MYIQEVIIDGFKSYAQRVTLSNFDSTFNAITGLNGSGKSNILDSVCFVLGIKNLSQVRATNLQELVYKQGQAGITKATVSIVWHNDNPATGPAGYEDKEYITITRQVVIGGRNKYLINGHAAQENRVADLFHSVQLNVNNPHFLIMQGRITKVLNMKPPEIMSLLEEAAGTRMYEKKKDSAVKTLEKKQMRLNEIDSVLDHDITPALVDLRRQCGQYQEWSTLSSSKERLKRFTMAYDYTECIKQSTGGQKEITAIEAAIGTKSGEKEAALVELEDKKSMIKDLQTEKEIQAGGEIKELQKSVDALNMKVTKDATSCKNKVENRDSDKGKLKLLQVSLQELLDQDPDAKVSKAEAARDVAKTALEAAEHSVEAATRELAGAEAGDGRDESNRSLQERMADTENAQSSADADATAADMKAKHTSKQLGEMQKQLASKDKESGTLQRELHKHQQAVEEGRRRLQDLRFDENEAQRLEEAREKEAADIRQLKDERDRLSQDVAGCDFRFSDPRPGFDRSKVKGVVAKLVQVKDLSASTALEVAAGGKLYQVVVEDEVTAKELLEKGRLQKRVTIIPLTKIQYHTLSGHVIAAAEKMGGGKARPALELVGYEAEVEAAIKYTFGTTFICQDSGTAKKLAFSREVGTRCITLEGDDFNPTGLLTGGSRSVSRSLLNMLHELAAKEAELAQHVASLEQVNKQLTAMGNAGKEYRKLKQDLELKSHSLGLLQSRIEGSEVAQLSAQVEALDLQMAEAKKEAEDARKKKQDLVDLRKQLEQESKDFGKERDKKLKGAKDKLKAAKAIVEGARKTVRKAEQVLQEALAERDAASGERVQLETRIADAQQALKGLEAEVVALQSALAAATEEHGTTLAKLEGRRERLRECDAEIRGLEKERDRAARKIQEVDTDIRKLESKVKSKSEEMKRFIEHVEKLEKTQPWVLNERDSFGRGDYDFSKYDINAMKLEYTACENRLEELKGKVNHKCTAKLQEAESEFSSLQEKRTIVENDKTRITQVIDELDEKKKAAMKETWQKVNTDFGSIFSTLLPGTQAKLEPPEGETFLAGLEVRVAFGGVWKESLTELSGGQRSLIALSLILALCRFKPAPLYILDEVDAALDLNHTQNIGRMIKQHFPQSQFLIVSLKEGMFNNANVVFRTKFVDGVSAVTRTVQHHQPQGHGNRENAGGKAHPTGAAGRQVLKDANRA